MIDIIIIVHCGDNLVGLLIGEFYLIFDRDLFEKHFVLCKCPCLIRENILYTSQLLRTVTVASDCVKNKLIFVYAVCIKQFGEIKIDTHRNRYNRAKKNEHTHELYWNVHWISPL